MRNNTLILPSPMKKIFSGNFSSMVLTLYTHIPQQLENNINIICVLMVYQQLVINKHFSD